MLKWIITAMLLSAGLPALFAQTQLINIMSYNLLNYPQDNPTLRNPHFRTIMNEVDPDILVGQELQSQAGVDGFLNDVLNHGGTEYSAAPFSINEVIANALFYRTSLFTFISNTPIETPLREINEFKLVYTATGDTVRIFALHLKASNDADDIAQRAEEVDSLRNFTNLLPVGTDFIVCGDFNIRTAEEPAFQKLLEYVPGTAGHVYDPINVAGNWHNGDVFASLHTQSPRLRTFGSGVTGGLDDRFDLMLLSESVFDTAGMTYLFDSYTTFGNDGLHFNDSINALPNNAVSAEMANALHQASDHIPIFAQFAFDASRTDETAKILISEVLMTPSESEYIEIYNPTGSAVELTDYYITDATLSASSEYYYNIVNRSDFGGGSAGDFHARFPLGAMIQPGEYQTIALAGDAAFFAAHGVQPTYELFEDNLGSPDDVPNMREAVAASIANQGQLADSEEAVILYFWNGNSDLVQDVDYLIYDNSGQPPAAAVDKSGISIDGPDEGSATSNYLNDTPINSQAPAGTHGIGASIHRIDFNEGVQTAGGGNGISGADETSEDLNNTFTNNSLPSPNAAYQSLDAEVGKILISELLLTPTEAEFIEIYNPGSAIVNLSDCYISDATFITNGDFYYNIVTGSNFGGGSQSDFHARFPDGALIQPGEYQTIALNGDGNFKATLGVLPTYELFEDDANAPEDVPDMREAVSGSINGQGGLSNGDEMVALYYWDGAADLVTDLDYLIFDDAAAPPDEAVDKSGVTIDGPDAGTDASTYLNDTPIGSQLPAPSHTFGFSTHRIDFTEGSQTTSGGNGFTGGDETSEDLNNTFTNNSLPSPNNAHQPSSGQNVKLLISEIAVTPTEGEFIEIHNPNSEAVDLSLYYLTDATFANGSTYYYNIVTGSDFGGGGFGDFHARFPDGATIDPGEYQTIAITGDGNFFNTYGVSPTYELFEDGQSNPVDAPDMREAVSGSINNQGALTNGDEVVVLYRWSGLTDLVEDVDYVIYDDAGLPPDEAVDKSGVGIDGPDLDTNNTTYLNDTPIASQQPAPTHAFGFSTQRIDLSEGAQVSSGGNGITGADETSEDLNNTFTSDSLPTPNAPISGNEMIDVEIDAGWNLLSLCCEVGDASYQALFPNANAGTMFGFDGAYVAEDTFRVGEGNWLNFPAAETASLSGDPITAATIDLGAGWNLIGGLSCPVAVLDISDPGGIVTPGTVFGFNGAYVLEDTLAPGKGYWINTSAAGQISIACGGAPMPLAKSVIPFTEVLNSDIASLPQVIISDAAGNQQTLYFNAPSEAGALSSFQLPPRGPAGSFDVRFPNGYRLSYAETPAIEFQAAHYPLEVEFRNLPIKDDRHFALKARVGDREMFNRQIQNQQKTELSNPEINRLQLAIDDGSLPKEFAVSQNYPNPFNPTTEIRISLPAEANVNITIFNTLGQRVKTVLSARKKAGFHKVAWDGRTEAGAAAASGIYIYRVTAGEHVASKKMLLLR